MTSQTPSSDQQPANEPVQATDNNSIDQGFKIPCMDAIIWWMMLVIAVLAVPCIAILVSLALPISNMAKVVTFVVSCWVCTWLGMWLMRRAEKSNKS